MQRFLVYQSLWAMERRRPDGHEWSLDEKLEMIRDAGFKRVDYTNFSGGITALHGGWKV